MTNKPEFEREYRYVVLKRSDLDSCPVHRVIDLSLALEHLSEHLPAREYLVIESDWPEYEPAWQMIERRMTGVDPVPPAGGEPGSMAQPVRPLAGLPERHDFPHRSEFETANQYTSALDTAKTWNAACDEWAPHVTRLQAEVRQLRQHKNDYMEAAEETRKALQAEAVERNAWAHEASARIDQLEDEGDALQSELTKAREFLSKANIHVPVNYPLKKEIIAFLSNQSAPADKEGQSWTV